MGGAEEASKKAKESKKKEKKEKASEETGGGEAPAEPKRAQRATSNVFSMFKQAQIQEFKEAFTMIDQNRDGFICESDLREMFQQTGREPRASELEEMIKEAPGPLNFTMFLTLFGEKLHGTDPENTLKSAFAMFDEEHKGFLDEEYIKDLLMNTGDPFTKDEIKQTWKEAPIEEGKFDYELMARIIKRGKEEDLVM